MQLSEVPARMAGSQIAVERLKEEVTASGTLAHQVLAGPQIAAERLKALQLSAFLRL